MDNTPATYSEFLRDMRTLCSPQSCNLPKFERACEAMWYDGVVSSTPVGKFAGVSRQTAVGWVKAAKHLGLQNNTRRARSAAHEKESKKQTEQIVAMSTDEMRNRMVAKLHQQFDAADNPAALTQLTGALTSVVPGLKAPETRLDVQILIGRDNTERIEQGLADNLKWIMGHDRNFGLRLLEAAGITSLPSAQDVTDAEITTVDDEPNSGRPDHRGAKRG